MPRNPDDRAGRNKAPKTLENLCLREIQEVEHRGTHTRFPDRILHGKLHLARDDFAEPLGRHASATHDGKLKVHGPAVAEELQVLLKDGEPACHRPHFAAAEVR